MHEKTGEENWVPLFDDAGVPLYPELMAELDAIKRERIGGLMLRRDWGERALADWPTGRGDLDPHEPQGEEDHPRRRTARRADVHLVPSWRLHRGGRCRSDRRRDQGAGRHKSAKVLPRYAKRTMKQVEAGAKKRRAMRTKADNLSE